MANPTDPARPVPPAAPSRSPAAAAGDVIRHGTNLIQEEVQLAKAEMAEKLSQLKTAVGEIVGGAVMLMVSLGILLAALVSAVARLLVGIFGAEPEAAGATVVEGLDETGTRIVTAVNDNVTAALDAARTLPTYEALAALIVGVIFAVIGGLLLKNGLSKLDADNLAPSRTVRQVKRDGEMIRDRT